MCCLKPILAVEAVQSSRLPAVPTHLAGILVQVTDGSRPISTIPHLPRDDRSVSQFSADDCRRIPAVLYLIIAEP